MFPPNEFIDMTLRKILSIRVADEDVTLVGCKPNGRP